MFKKFKKIVYSCYLCIRFPFLYPRNRFTGLHYNCWKLVTFHSKWWKYTEDVFFIKISTDTDKKLSYATHIDERKYCIEVKDGFVKIISLYNREVLYKKPISEFGEGEIIKCGWEGKEPYLIVNEDFKVSETKNGFVKIVHVKWLQRLIKIFDWINEYPLQIFHCIPDYTELDAMPKGWRKAFGIQMCKDIKKALKKHKYLYKYRIVDIKEKFGTLRWYDAGAPKEVYELIDKYEILSSKICIECGEPVKYITQGWISPYCKQCVPKNRLVKDIDTGEELFLD